MIATLIRQALHDMDAALEQAAADYGHEDRRTLLLGDAVDWLREWHTHWHAAHLRHQSSGMEPNS